MGGKDINKKRAGFSAGPLKKVPFKD